MIDSSFRVRVVPRPTVVDGRGVPVPGAMVLDIHFPGETIETSTGPVAVIAGAGIAKIMVEEQTIRGVSLC